MLSGASFRELGRPFVAARVNIPALAIWAHVLFLVDTGADKSLLSANDARRLGINYRALGAPDTITGVGGALAVYPVQATLAFADSEARVHFYTLTLDVASSDTEQYEMPSLLGRDILSRWRMIHDPSNNRLLLEVVSADQTAPADDNNLLVPGEGLP